MSKFDMWLIIGLIGQVMFSMRFILQWIASERHKKSVIPISFWYFSIAGSILLLAYSIHRQDPVFIIGQSLGCVIYFRNLVLIDRDKRNTLAAQENLQSDE
ncbi:MAG: lipid A biosynthesis protein [Candidatus Riflebacteria bacterium GWC2_50_8]|nr:MAG: lipid A biosynthesis protein [Candidatus Riflebacteria bacterium GWC2_50_8]